MDKGKRQHDDSRTSLKPTTLSCTSPELTDVWLSEIGPKLTTVDLVVLSMVSHWGHNIAHNITHPHGYALIVLKPSDLPDPFVSLRCWWKHLKPELFLDQWEFDLRSKPALTLSSRRLIDASLVDIVFRRAVFALTLVSCRVSSFGFLAPERLERLVLRDTLLKDDVRASLQSNLITCSQLTALEISGARQGDGNWSWFANILEHLPRLTQLWLRNNQFGPEGIKQLTSALATLRHVTSLDLGYGVLSHEGIGYLIPALSRMTHLSTLNLQNNYISPVGALHLALAMSTMHHITSLNFQNNQLGPEGARHLATVLIHLPHITFLNIRMNYMLPEGVAWIVPALANMSNMKDLNLYLNWIGVEGSRLLAPVLANMTRITYLNLRMNKLKSEGAKVLAPSIEMMPQLSTLNIQDNRLGSEGISHLVPVLSALPCLTSLALGGNDFNRVTKESVQNIFSHLPDFTM